MLSSLADLLARMFGATRHAVGEGARAGGRRLESHLGGQQRTEVIVLLAAVLALSSADIATVGASATQLRAALHIDNTDIGLLVAVNAAVAAVFSLPFGYLADRFRRTRMLAGTVFLWGGAMLWSAAAGSFDQLLLARVALGVVTAAAGPVVASLIGDYFPSTERGRIYGYVLTGELVGAGIGFAVTGDIAALSWRAAFVILALPTFVLARLLFRLPEPIRGGLAPLLPQPGRGVAAAPVGAAPGGGGVGAAPGGGGGAPDGPPLSIPPPPGPAAGAGDETVVFPAQPAIGGYPAATGMPDRDPASTDPPYTDPPYTDPTGRLDPRFPAPGYTSAQRGDNSGGYDWRYPLARGDRSGDIGPVPPTAASTPGGAAGPAPAAGGPGSAAGSGSAGAGGTEGTEGSLAGTDAQRLAAERGIGPDEAAAAALATPMGIVPTIRALLSVRTNTVLIVASALGYFYLAGIETFGIEFTKLQYGVSQALANVLLLVVGAGSVVGVLVAGPLSDHLLRGGRLTARISTSAVAAGAAVVMFIPALLTRSTATALPYLLVAALMLAAQNPPIDAARLDIVPAPLWGRAEGLRTALRTAAQSVAPVAFGGLADLFGGHRSGLRITFLVMLIPLAGNAYVLFRARRSYPRDVATAGAATSGAANFRGGTGGGSPRHGGRRHAAAPAPARGFDETGAAGVAGQTGAREQTLAPEASGQPEQWPEPTERVHGWPELRPSAPGPNWRDADDWDPGWPRTDREGSDRP